MEEVKLPTVRVSHPHVTIDEKGRPLIEGTRIPVSRLWSWHRQSVPVDTILRRYPQLGPARVFDALAFAYDNVPLMDADLLREREEAEHASALVKAHERATEETIRQQEAAERLQREIE